MNDVVVLHLHTSSGRKIATGACLNDTMNRRKFEEAAYNEKHTRWLLLPKTARLQNCASLGRLHTSFISYS
jgi:hypothetical protein